MFLASDWNDWGSIYAATGGAVPKNASILLDLRQLLARHVGADDACLVATYIGTGRSKANTSVLEVGVNTAEEDCGCDSWFGGRTVAEALAATKAEVPADVWNVLAKWADQKSAAAVAGAAKSYKEDADKLQTQIATTAAGVAGGVGIVYLAGIGLLALAASRKG